MNQILENTEYKKQVSIAVEQYSEVLLHLVKRSYFQKSIEKGSSLTQTDILNLVNTLFGHYKTNAHYKNRSKSILSLIYGSSSKTNSATANDIYKYLLASEAQDSNDRAKELPQFDVNPFRGLVEFLKNVAPSKSDYSLKLAISVFGIDISKESLLVATDNLETLKSELNSLQDQLNLIKEPGRLVSELKKLKDSVANVHEKNIEAENSILSIKKDVEKSENLNDELKKKSRKNTILIYVIVSMIVGGLVSLFLIYQPAHEGITMLDIELSNPIPVSNQTFHEEFLLEGVLNDSKSVNKQLLNFKLSNYTSSNPFFIDAISLKVIGSPSRISAIEHIKERQVDSLHFLLNKKAKYYSIKTFSEDGKSNPIAPKESTFFSLQVGGIKDLKNLEFAFQIIIEGHDSQGKSISLNSPKDYSIIFR